MADTKMVNGKIIPLSKQEQTELDARNKAWADDANNRDIKLQIISIEGKMPRYLREAILDLSELQNIDSQIAALRKQLT